MRRQEFETSMKWLQLAAKRAALPLASMSDVPEAASELVFWERYLDQLNQLAVDTDCPHVGLSLGQEIRYTDYGPHGYVLISAADSIDRFLELMSEINHVRHSVSHVEYRRLKRYGSIYFQPVEVLPLSPVEVDMTFAALVQFLRNYLGTRWTPNRVFLRRTPPKDVSPYQELLGERVRFSQKRDYMEIDASYLNIPINDADSFLHQTMRDYAGALIQNAAINGPDISAQVKFLLLNSLGTSDVTQESLAVNLSMSRATLQRRLEAEGTHFRMLRNEVVGHLARKYLLESNLPIATIADKLSFADNTSFTRAFSAFEGVSPSTYRRLHCKKD